MNSHEILEVRRSWALAGARLPFFAARFRARMRLSAIPCRALFADDAETSARLLLRLVGIAVNGLNQPRILIPLLETLGRQNARRMPDARQGRTVIRALLRALRAAIGPTFDGAVRHAWIEGYRVVARAMAAGMAEAAHDDRANAGLEVHPAAPGRIAVNSIHSMRRAKALGPGLPFAAPADHQPRLAGSGAA